MRLKVRGREAAQPPEPELELWLEDTGVGNVRIKGKCNGHIQILGSLYVSKETGKLKLHRTSVYGEVARLIDKDSYQRIVTNGKEVEG